jgi:hypothetical protein
VGEEKERTDGRRGRQGTFACGEERINRAGRSHNRQLHLHHHYHQTELESNHHHTGTATILQRTEHRQLPVRPLQLTDEQQARPREKERERENHREIYICKHTHIYIYIHRDREIPTLRSTMLMVAGVVEAS